MSVDINRTTATKLLNNSLIRCTQAPVTTCLIKDTIDFIMSGKNCLTYRYIMFTALVAKAVNPDVDILSLQAKDKSSGAYDPRSLAAEVVYPFQRDLLGNILDGSNADPLVNKPARFERLRKDNPVANGDPKIALELLCDNLVRITDCQIAETCVDYIVSTLIAEKSSRDASRAEIESELQFKGVFEVQKFLDDLLNQGFGGAALVIATTAIYKIIFNENSYDIKPHPVNQSGTSKRQFSDLDVYRSGKPFMGTELKDKPFTSSDVEHAAETAFKAKSPSLLFVAGRQSTFAAQPPTYFLETKKKYAEKGMYVGVISIDSLIDMAFASHMDNNPVDIIHTITHTSESIGAIEAQIWIYKQLSK